MRRFLNPLLALCLLGCALLLVNAQHQTRRLFIELEGAQAQSRKLEIDGRQLQLEQSRLSQHARIEVAAKRELNMLPVQSGSVIYLTTEAK